MTTTQVRLAFFKLNVAEMEPALSFWRAAFGFEISATFDEPEFYEHVLALPDLLRKPLLREYVLERACDLLSAVDHFHGVISPEQIHGRRRARNVGH